MSLLKKIIKKQNKKPPSTHMKTSNQLPYSSRYFASIPSVNLCELCYLFTTTAALWLV